MKFAVKGPGNFRVSGFLNEEEAKLWITTFCLWDGRRPDEFFVEEELEKSAVPIPNCS